MGRRSQRTDSNILCSYRTLPIQSKEELILKILNNNQLKIIALISMTIDHIGVQLFPDIILLRIIGRLAFPIFAYMIAEGVKYTKNRRKYILTISVSAIFCQFVYFFAERSLYQCILVTFSLSILLIYALEYKNIIISLLSLIGVFIFTEFVNIDYGFLGILTPVFIYFASGKANKLISCTALLILLGMVLGGVQWYALFAIPLLALYNGKRGKLNLKYLFYIYYPLHLGIIYLLK